MIFLAFAILSIFTVVNSQSRCVEYLGTGSSCVDKRADCPTGTIENPIYSNFVGCGNVNGKCCQVSSGEQVLYAQDRSKCGLGNLQVTSRVLDGYPTGVCDWPFVVSIRGRLQDSNDLDYDGTSHACQGVLIDPYWVLTSPYCILSAADSVANAPADILVVAGEYNVSGIDISPTTEEQQEQLINVESAHLYPSYPFTSRIEIIPFIYNTTALNSDGVALLKLTQPINGQCSGVACIPTEAEAANGCAAYDTCVLTGWGFATADLTPKNDLLLISEVQMTSYTACDFLTQRLSLQSVRPKGSICQAPRLRNTDSCLSDEGGAVLCASGNNWVVRAILPFNFCVVDQFNLFVTDVAPYLQWIEDTIASTATFVSI